MAAHKKPQRCLVCGGSVEEGWIQDHGYHNITRQEWASEDASTRSFLGLFHMSLPKVVLKVATYRCTSCGFLMEFANPNEPAA